MGQPGGWRQVIACGASEKPVWSTKRPARPMVNHYLHFASIVCRGDPSFSGAACDPFQPSWPACPFCRVGGMGRQSGLHHRQPGGRLRGRPVPGEAARNAEPMPPSPIVSRGILPQASSYRRVDPGRDHRLGSEGRTAKIAAIRVAANTSPLPASAEAFRPRQSNSALPQRRPGNDVTLPREAGNGGHISHRASGPRAWREAAGVP